MFVIKTQMTMMWKAAILFLIPLCFAKSLKTCDHPTAPYTCDSILNYMTCLGRTVQDCTQTDQYVYWRFDDPMSWNNAHAACETVDRGNLVSIHNFDENNIVMALKAAKTVQTYTWIGLYCTGSCTSHSDDGTNFWSDGTPLNYIKAIHRGGSPQCAVVTQYHENNPQDSWDARDSVQWDFEICDNQYMSICKAKIQQ